MDKQMIAIKITTRVVLFTSGLLSDFHLVNSIHHIV